MENPLEHPGMAMYEYLLINFFIIIFPLLFSFEKRIQYFRKLPAVATSILVVGIGYILWDFLATSRGDWAFNDAYILGATFLGLPVEELLFFITAPYSCLFIYEALSRFITDRKLSLKHYYFIPFIIFFTGASLFYWNQSYTATALAVMALFFFLTSICYIQLFQSFLFWLYSLIAFIPFVIFNYILTSLPVVTYNSSAIWGTKITTIPVEDFFFNFSMLSFHVLIYHMIKTRLLK